MEDKNKKNQPEVEEEQPKRFSVKKLILILFLIGIILLLWARFISTSGLIVKEYPIHTTNLSNDYDGFKILQITDLHYGSTIFLDELDNLISKANRTKPDIIVFTGDLVERGVTLSEKDITKIQDHLKKLEASVEIMAVRGNHDYESDYFDKILESLDWIILDNKYEFVYSNSKTPIVFVGLDDYTLGKPDYDNAFSYLNDLEEDVYTIVLAHEPDQVDEFKNYRFDLVLSGHSHLGQVRFPFVGAIYTPIGSKKYYDEHYKIDNADLYISGGVGTSTLPLRFLNKPSINLYRFFTN